MVFDIRARERLRLDPEDPLEVLGIEPRSTGSKPAVLTTAPYLWDSRAGSRTRAEAVKEPYPDR